MKANELMIGGLFRVNSDGLCIKKDTVVEVRGIDADNVFKNHIGSVTCRPLDKEQFDGGIWCDFLDPIPLTPEILEKNGFKTMEFYSELLYNDWQIMCDCSTVAARNKRGWSIDVPCCYVHELQHALRLCGIDKEITI